MILLGQNQNMTIVETTIVRPDNTSAYNANAVVMPSPTAVQSIDGCVRKPGGWGVVVGAQVLMDFAPATKGSFILQLYDRAYTPQNDNGSIALSDTEAARMFGAITMSNYAVTNGGTDAAGNMCYSASAGLAFCCEPSSKKLYPLLVIGTGFTPTNLGKITIRLYIVEGGAV